MTAFALKIIAAASMIIDHTAVCLLDAGILHNGAMYALLRGAGRLAFPLYGFLLANGAKHTKNKRAYVLRLVFALILSEWPFDAALFGTSLSGGWKHQSVMLNLLVGLLVIYVMQWAAVSEGSRRKIAIPAAAAAVVAGGLLCRFAYADYLDAGVVMIAVMGLTALPDETLDSLIKSERKRNAAISAAAILLAVIMLGRSEIGAVFALIPIALYNGKRGYDSRVVKYGFYLVYPAHLIILALIFHR